MFIAAWKQPKCPSAGMDKDDVGHTCDGRPLSHGKERSPAIGRSADATGDLQAEWVRSAGEKHRTHVI